MTDPEDLIPNWAFKRIGELAESDPHAGVHGVRQMAAHCDMWRRSFARYVVQQEAKHRETLAVLQTSHESEMEAQAQIQSLREIIKGLLEHSELIGVVGDHFAAEARAATGDMA